MNRLPDGSGFFIMAVGGPRPSGFVNWLKYTEKANARPWLFFWRMYRSAFVISRDVPSQGPPLGHWRSLRYAFAVRHGGFWS
jgi:hypothetical protein